MRVIDKYEWLEMLGCLFHLAVMITISSILVTIVLWITSLLIF